MSIFIPDATALDVEWRKSSHSGSNSNCVETGVWMAGVVVRDSKNPHAPAVPFAHPAWAAFTAEVKRSL
ncbi:DUF397 domain-containing protein [Streptomyces paludis]|uniref:DUF397 domain-containing protein n=1 Tax=Streptomyces paludis TaxID=2282738 RepID=A0A345HR42_9ACTN|nr:DUF397 domain-containing protein [Streptomyces paludis]AXG79166.1 DUF397 domain-containing protein [Streptomyces paludis]